MGFYFLSSRVKQNRIPTRRRERGNSAFENKSDINQPSAGVACRPTDVSPPAKRADAVTNVTVGGPSVAITQANRSVCGTNDMNRLFIHCATWLRSREEEGGSAACKNPDALRSFW